MKKGLRAILLAAGLTVSMFGSVYAEAETEAVTEAAATEAVSEGSEEAAEAATEAPDGSKYAVYYDAMKDSVPATLTALNDMTDEQLEKTIAEGSQPEIIMASNWKNVKEELGKFVEIGEQTVVEDGDVVTVTSAATYDGVNEKTKVNVIMGFDFKSGVQTMEWDVTYTLGKLMEQAALNTIMGIGIVFLMLLFLSFLISQMHWIPDLVEGRKKKAAPAPAPAAAPAPVVETVEEDLTDDLELVAVISAAIAASENTSTDGFVVRSIKKANRRKWQNA